MTSGRVNAPSLPPLVDHLRLNLVHLVIDIPHRGNSDKCCDANDAVVDDLRLCIDLAIACIMQNHAKVDSDKLLWEREECRDAKDNNTHATG
jgi:hypothetical protein